MHKTKKKKKRDRRESRGFIVRGRSKERDFDFYAYRRISLRYARRVPDVPVAIHVRRPRGKTIDEPVGPTIGDRPPMPGANLSSTIFHARSFIRSLALWSCLRSCTQIREPGCIRMRERAAWVTSHACTGRHIAPLEYLSVCSKRVAPTTVTTIERVRLGKKVLTCLENWSRSSPRFDKRFKRE